MGDKSSTTDKKQEFLDKVRSFEYLRQARAAQYQGVYIALLVAAIMIFVELIAGQDIILKIILMMGFIVLAVSVYRKALVQTQKPVVAFKNGAATIERGPFDFKTKDGQEYVILEMSDCIYKDVKPKK